MKQHILFRGGPLRSYTEKIDSDKLSNIMILRFYNKIHTYKRSNKPNVYDYVKTQKVPV